MKFSGVAILLLPTGANGIWYNAESWFGSGSTANANTNAASLHGGTTAAASVTAPARGWTPGPWHSNTAGTSVNVRPANTATASTEAFSMEGNFNLGRQNLSGKGAPGPSPGAASLATGGRGTITGASVSGTAGTTRTEIEGASRKDWGSGINNQVFAPVPAPAPQNCVMDVTLTCNIGSSGGPFCHELLPRSEDCPVTAVYSVSICNLGNAPIEVNMARLTVNNAPLDFLVDVSPNPLNGQECTEVTVRNSIDACVTDSYSANAFVVGIPPNGGMTCEDQQTTLFTTQGRIFGQSVPVAPPVIPQPVPRPNPVPAPIPRPMPAPRPVPRPVPVIPRPIPQPLPVVPRPVPRPLPVPVPRPVTPFYPQQQQQQQQQGFGPQQQQQQQQQGFGGFGPQQQQQQQQQGFGGFGPQQQQQQQGFGPQQQQQQQQTFVHPQGFYPGNQHQHQQQGFQSQQQSQTIHYQPPQVIHQPPQVIHQQSPPQVIHHPPQVIHQQPPPQVIYQPPQVIHRQPPPQYINHPPQQYHVHPQEVIVHRQPPRVYGNTPVYHGGGGVVGCSEGKSKGYGGGNCGKSKGGKGKGGKGKGGKGKGGKGKGGKGRSRAYSYESLASGVATSSYMWATIVAVGMAVYSMLA